MQRNIRYLIFSIVISIFSVGIFQYYQNFNESRIFNTFLENAGVVSTLHLDSSEQFKTLLDFSEVSREEFESTLNNVISNAREAYEILNNTDSSLTLKEKELLSLATLYWLQGLELFEVSILTLIDNPEAKGVFECGCGISFKVDELVAYNGFDVPITEGEDFELESNVLESTRLRALGWVPAVNVMETKLR